MRISFLSKSELYSTGVHKPRFAPTPPRLDYHLGTRSHAARYEQCRALFSAQVQEWDVGSEVSALLDLEDPSYCLPHWCHFTSPSSARGSPLLRGLASACAVLFVITIDILMDLEGLAPSFSGQLFLELAHL